MEFINADVTVGLSRMPLAQGVGISISHRTADAGISTGTGVLFDRHGASGSASVVGLANARNAVRVGRP
ncbi:hypothetical protein ACFVTE_18175 [Arthrobacter sp. NPDC058097]|uniref:hypothetical protein n=1 Tax=Arthrobacter sp. NPDC058097 TaxID=3346340 RepID=UPI0036D8AED4